MRRGSSGSRCRCRALACNAFPATTALRWIKTMTDAGIFLREADPQDGRRIFIALSDGANEAMARYFEALDE